MGSSKLQAATPQAIADREIQANAQRLAAAVTAALNRESVQIDDTTPEERASFDRQFKIWKGV